MSLVKIRREIGEVFFAILIPWMLFFEKSRQSFCNNDEKVKGKRIPLTDSSRGLQVAITFTIDENGHGGKGDASRDEVTPFV